MNFVWRLRLVSHYARRCASRVAPITSRVVPRAYPRPASLCEVQGASCHHGHVPLTVIPAPADVPLPGWQLPCQVDGGNGPIPERLWLSKAVSLDAGSAVPGRVRIPTIPGGLTRQDCGFWSRQMKVQILPREQLPQG